MHDEMYSIPFYNAMHREAVDANECRVAGWCIHRRIIVPLTKRRSVSQWSVHAAACIADVVRVRREGRGERGVLQNPDTNCAVRSLWNESKQEGEIRKNSASCILQSKSECVSRKRVGQCLTPVMSVCPP